MEMLEMGIMMVTIQIYHCKLLESSFLVICCICCDYFAAAIIIHRTGRVKQHRVSKILYHGLNIMLYRYFASILRNQN